MQENIITLFTATSLRPSNSGVKLDQIRLWNKC